MHFFLKLHQLAAQRGDGLRPEWLELLTQATSADEARNQPPVFKVVQPGDHPDGVSVVPLVEDIQQPETAPRKATA